MRFAPATVAGGEVEPWTFLRAGDALIADAVEEHTDIAASSCRPSYWRTAAA